MSKLDNAVELMIQGKGEKTVATNAEPETTQSAFSLESQAFNIYTRTKWASLMTQATGSSAKSKNKSLLIQIKDLWNSSSQNTKEKYL